jgi:hypothetical protein
MHKTIYFFAKTVVILVVLFLAKAHVHFNQQNYKTGVDFTKGRWLLNQLDCPGLTSNLMRKRLFSLKKI